LQLHTELRLVGFANAALLLVTLRALLREAGLFFGARTGFLRFARRASSAALNRASSSAAMRAS